MTYNDNLFIPMTDTHKTIILDAIMNTCKKDINDFKIENDLETFNSIHTLKWDYIFRNLVRTLPDSEYEFLKVKRGSLWELVLIYEKKSGFIYSMMQEKRFFQLKDELNKRFYEQKSHYLDVLSYINKDFKPHEKYKEPIQLSMFGIDRTDWFNKIQIELNKILEGLDPIQAFVIITFSIKSGEIASTNAYIPTSNLEIAYKESWNEFIPADFSNVISANTELYAGQEEEIYLELQEGVTPEQKDEIVQLKAQEVDKQD